MGYPIEGDVIQIEEEAVRGVDEHPGDEGGRIEAGLGLAGRVTQNAWPNHIGHQVDVKAVFFGDLGKRHPAYEPKQISERPHVFFG